MLFYNFFLKIYALKFLFYKGKKDDDEQVNNESPESFELNEVVISVESGQISQTIHKDKEKCMKRETLLKISGIVYFTFVALCVGWQCIYSIVKALISLNSRYFTSSIFSFLYLAQLIAGAIFYNQKFFTNAMKKITDYHTILLIMFIISGVISLILTLISIIFLINGTVIINYTDIYNNVGNVGKVFITILLFFQNFYAYNLFFINIIIFGIILICQRMDIAKYNQKMKEMINGNIQDMTITSIIEDFSKMQSYYNNTVKNLNLIFTSTTVIGIIASYFVLMNIGTQFVNIYAYIDMALFFIIEIIYITTISNIDNTRQNIQTLAGSYTFIAKFLNKNSLGPIYGDIYEHDDIRITRADNNQMIINTYEEISTRDQINVEKKIDLIKNITFRNIILSNQNGVSLDWVVLHDKLTENWQSFQIFTYNVDSTQIIPKLLVIVFGLSAIIQLNFKIGV